MDWLSVFLKKKQHFSRCSAEGFSNKTRLAGSWIDLVDLRRDGVLYNNYRELFSSRPIGHKITKLRVDRIVRGGERLFFSRLFYTIFPRLLTQSFPRIVPALVQYAVFRNTCTNNF